ncbi:MAG TPA: TldD/PmbA family protein [Myxococcales bacterium]|nr:TldD/PmbA family protein [Myxococcales bacterium]
MARQKAAPIRQPLLPLPLVEKLIAAAMSRGAEFAEVYVERSSSTNVTLDEGQIKTAQAGSVTGVGVRAIRGAQVGYAHSDDLDEPTLLRTAQTAALIADGNNETAPVNLARKPLPTYYQVRTPLSEVGIAGKIALLKEADAAARAYDKRIKQVTGGYADTTREILVANTLGHLAEDRQDLCRLGVQCVAFGKGNERRTGYFGGGGRVDFRFFEDFSPTHVAREAARQAIATLGAVAAPSGPTTVVLAPGWSGILLHEAVGHGLEADYIRKGTSLFAGKLGEKVASELVTVIDDGTVAGGRGSINVDDEGNQGERKVLIENGVLKGYLYDHLNARLTGKRSTGSGRRQSFRNPPLPRMTNTYLAPGNQTPEEILKGVNKGLYCRQFGGGQVDIANGNFVFEISEAYLIEDGEITRPVKGAMLIGVGPEALKKVSAVGNDPALDPGLGVCGKSGQMVPVGVGLPTLRIDELTVGGTGA